MGIIINIPLQSTEIYVSNKTYCNIKNISLSKDEELSAITYTVDVRYYYNLVERKKKNGIKFELEILPNTYLFEIDDEPSIEMSYIEIKRQINEMLINYSSIDNYIKDN